jgi:hypothetical protein
MSHELEFHSPSPSMHPCSNYSSATLNAVPNDTQIMFFLQCMAIWVTHFPFGKITLTYSCHGLKGLLHFSFMGAAISPVLLTPALFDEYSIWACHLFFRWWVVLNYIHFSATVSIHLFISPKWKYIPFHLHPVHFSREWSVKKKITQMWHLIPHLQPLMEFSLQEM